VAEKAGKRRKGSAARSLIGAGCLDKTALRGVWRAYEYIFEFNPRAAADMADALFAAGDGLVNFPHRGRLVPGTFMRELVGVRPYVIRYRIDVGADTVVILRIRHSARRPTKP
jgi:plasmid stabilization system protein ParE